MIYCVICFMLKISKENLLNEENYGEAIKRVTCFSNSGYKSEDCNLCKPRSPLKSGHNQ